MSWTASATVASIDVASGSEAAQVVLYATGTDVTSSGDDNVSSVSVTLLAPKGTHLAVGSKVTITADC